MILDWRRSPDTGEAYNKKHEQQDAIVIDEGERRTFIYPRMESRRHHWQKRYEYSTDGGYRFKLVNYPLSEDVLNKIQITSTQRTKTTAKNEKDAQWTLTIRRMSFSLWKSIGQKVIKEEMLLEKWLRNYTKSESDSSKIYYQECIETGMVWEPSGPASTNLKWKFNHNPHDTVLLLMTKVRRGTDGDTATLEHLEERAASVRFRSFDGKWNWETQAAK
jgi:hypothetical protein